MNFQFYLITICFALSLLFPCKDLSARISAKQAPTTRSSLPKKKPTQKTKAQKKKQNVKKVSKKPVPLNLKPKKSTHQPETPWSFSASFGLSRGLDEFDNTYGSSSFIINYRLSQKWNFSTGLSSAYRFNELESSTDPNFIVEDLNFSFGYGILANKKQHLGLSFSTRLPTSNTSQKSSLYFAETLGLSYSHSAGIWRFSPNLGLTYSPHEFETADKAGNVFNSDWMASLGSSVSLSPIERLSLSTGFNYVTYHSLAGSWKDLQSVSVSALYDWTPTVSTSVFYSSRNRLISNISLFDDDNTSLGGNISFQF